MWRVVEGGGRRFNRSDTRLLAMRVPCACVRAKRACVYEAWRARVAPRPRRYYVRGMGLERLQRRAHEHSVGGGRGRGEVGEGGGRGEVGEHERAEAERAVRVAR